MTDYIKILFEMTIMATKRESLQIPVAAIRRAINDAAYDEDLGVQVVVSEIGGMHVSCRLEE